MTENLNKCNVAILAGGMGTRLLQRSGDLPKPMVPVLGKPVLEYQIELCRKHGFQNIALLVQHQHHKISEYFGSGESFGVSLTYAIESSPRGTSGAIRDALPILADRFLVLYGDTFMDVDLLKIWYAHIASKASVTLLLHPNDHPYDSDLVNTDEGGFIQSILPYPHPHDLEVRNLVNAALYVFERDGIEDFTPIEGKADIAKDMFPSMLNAGHRLHGYITPEYIKDMGTPERLDKVERDYINGLPERLSARHLRSAVFLDRDGTLINEVNHLKYPEQVELINGVSSAIRQLNRSGTLAVVVTNQPVIARGDVTRSELRRIHARMESQLGAGGAYIDSLYICPHHPDKGFTGEVPELKIQCYCRKPEPGMIEQACRELNIDRRNSWMIGDTTSDIESARRAGVRSILVRTGFCGLDKKYFTRPDYICPDLPSAIDWVLLGHADVSRRMLQVTMSAMCNKRVVLIGGLARAGKSFAAQVLKEQLNSLGRTAHVISLDGWLKPKNLREECIGVCERYDMHSACYQISKAYHANTRVLLQERIYDRISHTISEVPVIDHSIGPSDIIIVEGVPALLSKELMDLPRTVKVYIDISQSVRDERLIKDYAWRGESIEHTNAKLLTRELDETPFVIKSRDQADYVLESFQMRTIDDRK